ncbi:hypothetical protein [Arthrobacter sp. A5]|uniref:hypothetical protein n=1 Tax=Arthrobacter sp. A5 TaxID=576926 RepID=UPI003DAA40ED
MGVESAAIYSEEAKDPKRSAALGLVLLLVLNSLAVIGCFCKHTGEYGVWTRLVAPAVSAVSLGLIVILILTNFNVLIGSEGASPLSWILPVIALLRACWARSGVCG